MVFVCSSVIGVSLSGFLSHFPLTVLCSAAAIVVSIVVLSLISLLSIT